MEEALDKQLKVGNSATSIGKNQRKGCYYTSIPRVVKCKGISAQELTSLNHDKHIYWHNHLSNFWGAHGNKL
ncbi:protein AAR2 [Trifolium pratense]|uniref:Protein AAR2 n=1 Tax=Trifolium pratense TaxID=57577 RepID=A0A2K3K3R3_TRIPR|nr:protein AAR2 [Trifolium pratense]